METPSFTYSDETKVLDIIIKGQHVILKIGDCIQFDKNHYKFPDIDADDDTDVEVTKVKTIGLIVDFAYSNWELINPNRIFYVPWIDEENRWEHDIFPRKSIGIWGDYLFNNEWTTIVKLENCPGIAKGGYKSAKKKSRNNRLRISKHRYQKKRISQKGYNKKMKTRKNKKMVGGWNNQRYYNPNNIDLLNDPDAISIGQFLINDELQRYLLNDDSYYRNNSLFKHTDSEFNRKLYIQFIKSKFKTDNDYKWLGNQFYLILGTQNPFHALHFLGYGYATWDDGVFFFDYITNLKPRNNTGFHFIPTLYNNPLNIHEKKQDTKKTDIDTIPIGIVSSIKEKYETLQ